MAFRKRTKPACLEPALPGALTVRDPTPMSLQSANSTHHSPVLPESKGSIHSLSLNESVLTPMAGDSPTETLRAALFLRPLELPARDTSSLLDRKLRH